MLWTLVCLGFVFSFVSACTHRGINPLGDYDSPYHRLLRSKLSSKGLYGFDDVPYLTTAVFRSEELRRLYVDEYARKYRLSEAEKTELLNKELSESQSYIDVVLVHFASDQRLARLDASDRVWTIRLDAPSGQSVRPSSVVQLPGERPVVAYFYPHITHWSSNYLVRFPIEAGVSTSSPMVLRLDSVEGNLSFKLKP